jgi:signal transduction histidine kinase
MQLLINDLLTFSRVGRRSEDFVTVDLEDVLRKAWHSLDAQVKESEGALELDIASDAHAVSGAPSLLEMLTTNLLSNAMKYRRSDVAPVVRVTAITEGDMARVQVADNGIGIPDEYAEKVFVIFQRLHAREEYEGTGIGLALAKKVVEFHGGSIGLAASPLGGACVTFTLPLAESVAHV